MVKTLHGGFRAPRMRATSGEVVWQWPKSRNSTGKVVTGAGSANLSETAKLMRDNDIGIHPVVDCGQLKGVVTDPFRKSSVNGSSPTANRPRRGGYNPRG